MPEPAWAQWSAAGAERPWTVGVEEEVMLLDRDRWGSLTSPTAPARALGQLAVLAG
jgi:hypothetical protein